jgi:hypothetical protein
MKKQTFLTALFVSTTVLLYAQSKPVTVYGFERRISGGMQKRGDVDESGKQVKTPPAYPGLQRLIYLASNSRVYPVQLWISGEAFAVKTKQVAALPGDLADSTKAATRSVSIGKFWQLIPLPLTADKSGGRAKALAINNDVVVLYKAGGKLRYGVLKKFAELNPAVQQ